MAERVTGVVEQCQIYSCEGIIWSKFFQGAESQPPAGILVEVLLNARSVEFATELYLVLVELPGEAVDDLVVGVDAVAGSPEVAPTCEKKPVPPVGFGRQKNDGQARRIACPKGRRDVANPMELGLKF